MQPVNGGHVLVLDGRRRARVHARRIAATEVALERLARRRIVEDRPVRAGDRAELAAHARVVEHVLGAGGVDGDGAHRAGGHAPALGALRARVGRVRGVALEGRHADDGLRRLERADLHVRARDLAAQAAGATLGRDLENFHRFFFPRPLVLPSRRSMNSSSGMAPRVFPAEPPRAPSSTDTREMVALSGASTIVTKSYGPRTAYCATTRAPMRPTSALTFRIQPGRSRSTLRPDSDSVLSMTYKLTAAPPSEALAPGTPARTGTAFLPLGALAGRATRAPVPCRPSPGTCRGAAAAPPPNGPV